MNETDNIFIFNNIKEQIELKNIIQIKGLFGLKKKYAILTPKRLLIYKNKNHFLSKKSAQVI